jgi:hypothetical protein
MAVQDCVALSQAQEYSMLVVVEVLLAKMWRLQVPALAVVVGAV